MSDKLVVEIDSKDAEVAMRNLDRLTTAAEQMGKAFENTKGATSALRELRLMLTGIKGQGSSLDELKNSIQSLNSTADSLKRSFAGSVGQLGRIFKNEMAELKSIVQETGLGVGRAAVKGIEDGMAEAPAAIRKQGRTIAAAAKAEATRIYEAMVAGQANAKIKDVGALFKLDEAGATLSPYHKQVLENWKKSSAETFRAMKAQLATEREQLEGQVKAENAALQSALKRMEDESKTRNASLTSIYSSSLARGNSSISQVRTALKAEAAQLQATVKSENDALQTALQSMESNSRDKAKSLAAIYRDSLGRGNFAMAQVKSRLKAESSELQAAVKAEESGLQRALQAMEASDKLRKSSLAEIYAGSLKRGDQGIARVKAQLREQADNIIQANKTELARVQAQVAAATNNAAGLYQKYNASTQRPGAITNPNKIPDVSKSLPKPAEIDAVANSFKRLTIDGNDAHSMARGLASGFNLLWLTWGNLAPLFVGAAISNGFVQTAKTGMAVAHTMETIAVLGGNTVEEMTALQVELDKLGKSGPFGPMAIADAMKVLSLAGLKANDILAVTQDVLNFSVAGTTDLKTAADSLVSISTAFAMGADGFGRVADVVSKAAAESKTSVESFTNAMKTASVIHKQYGVSLEDTATGIAALSQLGIEGTAAGTALRNMYADLSGRSMQVAKVLRAQGIEMRTATGEFRPMLEVVADLNTKLQTLDGIGQKNLLQAILSERGAKGIVELLQLINTEAKDMGSGLQNALQTLRKSIDESYGFAAISAAKLAQTTKSQFEAVKATLETSMNEAYRSIEPTLLLIADGLKKAFASPEFVQNLGTMVKMVGQLALSFVELTAFVLEHASVIAAAGVGYGVLSAAIRYKAASLAASTAATTADTAATLANNAAKAGAVGAIGTMARLLPGIGTAVTLATVAWMAYDFWQKSAKDTAKEASDLYNNNVIKNLEDEALRLKNLNDLRAKGLTLSQAQAMLDDNASRAKAVAPAEDAVVQAIKTEVAERAKLDRMRKDHESWTTREGSFKIAAQERAVSAAQNAVRSAKEEEASVIRRASEAQARVIAERKRDAEFLRIEAEKRSASAVTGSGKFQPGGDSGYKQRFEQIRVANDNELKEIEKRNAAELSMMQNQAANAQKILDARHQAGLISEGEYQAQAFTQVRQSEADQLAILNASKTEYARAYAEREATLQEALAKATNLKDATQIDKFTQDLENLGNTAKTFYEGVDASIAKLADNGMARLQVASIKAQAAIKKLADTEREYWKKDKDEINKLRSLDAMEAKYKNINESVFSLNVANKAAAMTGAAETEKFNAKLAEMDYAYEVAEQAALAFMTANIMALASGDTEAQKLYEGLRSVADALKAAREAAGVKAEASIRDRSLIAFEKARQAQIDAFSNGLADAVETSIFEGGKAGGQKFIEVIRNELLRKPLVAVIHGVMGDIVGGVFGGGAAGGAGGAGGIMGGIQTASNLNTLYGAGSQALFGGAAGASAASLGYANAIGMAGGDAIGALAAANGMWAGVATGAQAAAQAAIASNAAMAAGTAAALPAGTTAAAAGAGAGAGGASGALAAIPGWGWAAAAGVAVLGSVLSRKTEKRGSGLMGTLGEEDGVHDLDLMRKGGSLISGPKWFVRDMGVSGMDDALQETYKAQRDALMQMGDALGLATAGVENFTVQLGTDTLGDQKVRGIRLDGLSDEEANAKISEALATANNEIAQQIIGSWEATTAKRRWFGGPEESTTRSYVNSEFARDGEKAIDTLTRLATSLMGVNSVFENLGYTLYEASLAGGDMASQLVDMFGSRDAFNQATGAFFQNFYSVEDQRAAAQRGLQAQLDTLDMGLVLPDIDVSDARDQFRALAEAQDRSTEEGQKAWAMLIQLSGAFAGVTQSVDDAREAARQLAEEQARAARQLAEEQARAAKAAQDAAYSDFRRAVDRDRSILQDQASMLSDTIGSIADAVSMLKTNASELYGTVDSTAQMLAAQGMVYIENALAGVRAGGSVADYTGLGDAIGAARSGIDSGTYATQFERERDTLVLAGQLSELGTLGEVQLSIEERQLRAINSQLEYLDSLSLRAEEMVNGTTLLTETVDTYFARLMGILDPEKPEGTPGKPGSSGGDIFVVGGGGGNGVPGGDSGPDPDNWWVQLGQGTGGNGSNAPATGAGSAGPAAGSSDWWRKLAQGVGGVPSYDIGTNYVPRDMLAQIHEGEAIVPKAYNPAANTSMGGGNSEVVSELRALREENRQQAGEIARLNLRMARVLEKFDGDGMPATRDEAVV